MSSSSCFGWASGNGDATCSTYSQPATASAQPASAVRSAVTTSSGPSPTISRTSALARERSHRRAHPVAVLVQALDAVRADEAGAAGDEDELVGHGLRSVIRAVSPRGREVGGGHRAARCRQRDRVQRPLARRRQHHERRHAVLVRAQPVRNRDAPAASRTRPGKPSAAGGCSGRCRCAAGARGTPRSPRRTRGATPRPRDRAGSSRRGRTPSWDRCRRAPAARPARCARSRRQYRRVSRRGSAAS